MILTRIIHLLSLLFLTPLSWSWEYIYKIRRFLYKYNFIKSESFMVPIISIGNLTFGGTGKTPMVVWISRFLEKRNKKVLILTRGYKGELENSSGVIRSERKMGYNPGLFGDEALMLAKKLKKISIVVGKRRVQNLKYYFTSENPDIVLMDDGHQHLKLKRNLNFVLFDALMPMKKYYVAPKGYLREGLSALVDADIVIINRSDLVPLTRLNEIKNLIRPYFNSNVPICEIGYRPTGLFDVNFREVYELNAMKGKKVLCVAGIASPTSFFEMVLNLGCEIVDKFIFPDHHAYTSDDIKKIVSKSVKSQTIILTTEKDMTKIRRLDGADDFIFLGIGVYFLRGESDIIEALEEIL